jgi:RNA polymerase-binding transcription factor DksA
MKKEQLKKEEPKKEEKVKKLPKEKLKFYKNILLEMRDKITSRINHVEEDNLRTPTREAAGDLSGYSLHMADAATDTFDSDFNLSLGSDSYEILREIDDALERVENGTFGFSEQSGEFIGEKRLNAVPYARYTLQEQQETEREKHR